MELSTDSSTHGRWLGEAMQGGDVPPAPICSPGFSGETWGWNSHFRAKGKTADVAEGLRGRGSIGRDTEQLGECLSARPGLLCACSKFFFFFYTFDLYCKVYRIEECLDPDRTGYRNVIQQTPV